MLPELKRKLRSRKARIFERDRYRCAWCRRRLATEHLTLDHLIPRAKWMPHWGNKHQDQNVTACCKECGRIKADVWLDGISLSHGTSPRVVRVHWPTARYCFALLRASSQRRASPPLFGGEAT